MQIEWKEKELRCLQEQAVDVIYQEETSEFIVPDIYPDAAKVVEVTAVCCQRDQEVRSGLMSVSGSFQTTVVFLSEDGEETCVQNVFLPFAVRMTAEEITDGAVGHAEVRVRSADARILNSRKLMVRVSYAARLAVYAPYALKSRSYDGGGKVQLLQTEEQQYVPVAAAEKTVTFSEPIQLPQQDAPVQKLIRVRPSLRCREQRLTEGRAVWQGTMDLSALCLLQNGQAAISSIELPVSQFLDMDTEQEEASLRIIPVLTEFRMEEDASGAYLLTAGIRYQAMAWGILPVSVIRDGYCIGADFQAEYEQVILRNRAGEPKETVQAEIALREIPHKALDCAVWVDFPVCRRGEDEIAVGTSVSAQTLCCDENGHLCGETVRADVSCSFPAGKDTVCYADAEPAGDPSYRLSEKKVLAPLQFSVRCMEEQTLQTLCGAQIGEVEKKRENVPSLTVRRIPAGEQLWDVAKKAETTVQAVREANGLENDLLKEGMLLLIPSACE